MFFCQGVIVETCGTVATLEKVKPEWDFVFLGNKLCPSLLLPLHTSGNKQDTDGKYKKNHWTIFEK